MRIIIVGAGVLGASVAFHAALAGADVVVVDQAHEGRATAAGAGIVCPWAADVDDTGKYRVAAAGARYYPELVAMLAEAGEADIGYRQVGALLVSDKPAQLDWIERELRARGRDAPEAGEISRVSAHQARELFPPLRPDMAAVRIGGGARVDGRRLSAALARAARHHGAQWRHDTAELMRSGNRVIGVRIGNDELTADAVVVTAGAWAPQILRPIGVALPIEPQRGQIVHLGLPGVETSAWPVILPESSHYLLAFEDSRVVAGATRETGVGFDYRVTAAGLAEVLSEALSVAPGLASATLIETRIGFRPVGPDARPLLGGVPGLEALFIGNGLGPSGLTIGPYAGRLLAELALGRTPELDLAPYAPLRREG
jgi:D-amino-acid dehydrogenase